MSKPLRLILLLALALLPARGFPEEASDVYDTTHSNANLTITVRTFRQGREIKAVYTTLSGTQANLKVSDDTARAVVTLNFLPAVVPEIPGVVQTQYQIEVAEVGRKAGYQLQGELRVFDGKERVLMESRNDKVLVRIDIER